MYDLYATGATLGEVGERFDLTAERVRQIFRDAGLPARTIAETHALRNGRLIREKGDEIAAAFAESKDVNEVARRFNVTRSLVKEIANSRLSPRERRRERKPIPPKYASSEMLAFLREAAATASRPLSVGGYCRYAETKKRGGGRTWPSVATYVNRFGSWRKALRQAGLPVGPHGPSGAKPKFSEQACIEALREAARTLDDVPTITAYDELARDSGGRLPGSLTVKHRLGTWHSALSKAQL